MGPQSLGPGPLANGCKKEKVLVLPQKSRILLPRKSSKCTASQLGTVFFAGRHDPFGRLPPVLYVSFLLFFPSGHGGPQRTNIARWQKKRRHCMKVKYQPSDQQPMTMVMQMGSWRESLLMLLFKGGWSTSETLQNWNSTGVTLSL